MDIKEYKLILDSLQMTGIYVIREDNHEILYYNRHVKEIAPNIQLGMVCHEIWSWSGACANCPLLVMGEKKEASVVNYDHPFGEAVEFRATKVLWEDNIPAFVISITPYAETSNYVYQKVVRANLTADTFRAVKVGREELREMEKNYSTLTKWLKGVALNGYIYGEDEERYFSFIEHLKENVKDSNKLNNCLYRRKTEKGFRWHMMEVVRDYDYSDNNQSVIMYSKDVHDIFKEGLEREEVNIKNSEVIDALAEMNLGIYIVDLETGVANIVRTTNAIKEVMNTDLCFWNEMLEVLGGIFTAVEYQSEFKAGFSFEAMRKDWENGEKKKTFVYRARIDEDFRYVSLTVYFKEKKSKKGYAILTFQDVDERTRENMERIQNDHRMAVIIKSRYSIMNVVNLKNGQCERIIMREGMLDQKVEGDYDYYIKKALETTVAEEDKEKFKEVFLLENLRKNAEDVQDYREEVYQYRHKGLPVRWLEEHVLYIRQGEEMIVNILGRDITAEKQEEERAQRASRDRTSIINSLSSMFFATYYVDLERDTFRAVSQNEEAENVPEKEQSYTHGIHEYAESFVHPDDRAEYLAKVNYENVISTLSKEKPFIAVEYRKIPVEGRGNEWTRVTVVLAETFPDGRAQKAVYVAQDVTEVKLKEEQEQRALAAACDVANHANAAKSEFMSRMSHDIRTPLNAIIGMTAIAGRYLDDPKRVSDCLSKIVVSGRHLLSLVNEILDMSKIESGKIELVEEEINLSDMIDNLVTMIRPSMEKKGHSFHIHVSDIRTERVIGDSMRLQQIFMNIVGNSVKYTPQGGKIEMGITEKPSKVYGYGCYEFIFRDNGIGMSKEFQEVLFEPFTRAEDSRISSIEGTGLGMTIVKNIVRMMDGNIEVESEPGKGTQFTVTLFLRRANAEEPSIERLANFPVLVVDDDEIAGQIACDMLENIGMKGEYVLNGMEAVERVWERHQADEDYFAVILDWKMPGMDGMETARKIREKVGPDIPIIILSAYDWSSIEEEAKAAGVNGFIAKPLFRSRLLYLFNQFMDKEQDLPKEEKGHVSKEYLQGKRVLLVEDNEINREIAEELLGLTGVLVESAENGQKAVEKYEQMGESYYDMILMDIQMPVMNGYEATRAIRKLPRKDAAEIPIIALTANAFAEDVLESRSAGMNEHLTKPLNMEDLEECLARWLGKKV